MPTKQRRDQQPERGDEQRQQHGDDERRSREKLNTLIGEQVIRTLGRPPGLQQVQVRCLWEAHYRVNVLVGEDITSLKIAASYFVQADGNGNILSSDPRITNQYEPPAARDDAPLLCQPTS
jgi:hypothetical protein